MATRGFLTMLTVDTRLLLAWVHLLALAVGLAGVWARARGLRAALRNPEDSAAMGRAFTGDAWWGIAAILWLVTGVWRLFAGTEKNTSYYFANSAFHLKLGLFLLILALEIWPMMTLVRWRAKRLVPNSRNAGRIEIISYVQCALVLLIMFAAVSMARGYGTKPAGGAAVAATHPVARSLEDTETTRGNDTVATFVRVPPTGVETMGGDDLSLLTGEIGLPLDGMDPATLHSSFNDLRGGGTRPHEALDIMSPRRTPVHSAARGRVLKLFTSVAGGLMVYAADSSDRFVFMYAHLDGYAPGLRDGDNLTRGQLIGYVGSTGNAAENAPHLHFAIARSANVKEWWKGKPIDPLPILQASVQGLK